MIPKDEIIAVICKTLDIDKSELKDDEKLYDSIGVDSTEMVELVVALKKHFEIPLETNEITKFSTFNEIIETLEKKRFIPEEEDVEQFNTE